MGSKRKGGAHDLPSTSEEYEGSDRRKSPVWKTFRIYSSEYVTSSNRNEKRSEKIALNVNTTEREIRDILMRELPQLRGKRFKFFTKDEAGKWYFCPCSLKCEGNMGKDHSAEWSGRNIPRAAKSNRAVYILIESTTMEQTRSRGVQNDTSTNPLPTGPQFCASVGQYSSNPRSQKQVKVVVKSHQSVQSCPDFSLNGLKHHENTSVPPLSATYGNDLNQWPTYHLSQEQTIPETEYGKVKDVGRLTEEKDGEGEGRIDMGDEEMWDNDVVSTRGYDTSSLESSTHVPPEYLSLPMPDEELQPYLDSVLQSPDPTFLTETVNGESTRNPLAIEEIVPIKGDIKGGDSFVLCFAKPCVVDYCRVRFGIADPVPVIIRGNDYRGNTPPYHTPGEVEVQLVSCSGDPISDTVTFTYTDESAMKKWAIKPEDIRNMDAEYLPLALLEIAHRMGQMRLQPKENANEPEDANAEAMLLLRILAGTAAKINAIDFFRIVFSTSVGHSVFKCFKDEQPLLEDIARGNGHDELASFLKEKHLMYRDDENDSDGEVDWEELVKAIEQYQTLNGETNEKKNIRSAIMYGYLGDGESSTTLSSSEISVAESFPSDTLEDQDQAPLESKCPEKRSSRYARSERLVVLTGALKSSKHPEAAETGYYGTKCEEFLLFTWIWDLNLVWLKRKEISILLALLSFLLIFTEIFFPWPGPFRATRALAPTVLLPARPACAKGLSTILCQECGASLRNVNTVDTAQWKIKYPNTGWIKFSRCMKYNTSCVVTRPMLPDGIRVLKASIDTVILQRRVENNTDGYARLMFEVNYMDIPVITHVFEVNFTRRRNLADLWRTHRKEGVWMIQERKAGGPPVVLAQTLHFCQDDKITIWDPVTRSVQCHDCLKQCPAGQGLSASCGEVISTKTPVGCKQCVLGKTYSSAYEVGACKDCKNCGPYRKTIKACTLTSKAVCGSCKIGTYLEPVLGMCSPCSLCCNDGKDIFVPECQVPEVPINMRCSILRSTKCISAVVPSSVAIKPPPPQENNTNSKTKLISLNTYRHPQQWRILMFEITLFASSVLLLMSLVALVLSRGFRKDHANSNCYTPLFKDECTPICIVGSDQSCDFEMDPCISCLEKLKLIPEEMKINALPFKVEMMLMEKLDTKRPGQDWLDLGAKLGICVSGLGIVALEEKRGRSPTRCLFQILSSLENVVSLRTVVAATHMLGRHDICNATYEVCKSQGFIT